MTETEKIDWVYSQLDDDESKFIFQKRKEFNYGHDYKYIGEIIDRYVTELSKCKWYPEKEKDLIRIVKECGKKIVVFGAGYYGGKVLHLCEIGGVKVDFFCDNAPEKWHTKVEDKVTVISLQELAGMKTMDDYVIIVSPKYGYKEIDDMLVRYGISACNIYNFAEFFSVSLEIQYFDDRLFQYEQEEVFIDAGCFDFKTSQDFLNRVSGKGVECKKIYAFEPDYTNFLKCKHKIEKLGLNNVELVQACLWSKDTYLDFLAQGDGSSHLLFSDMADSNKTKAIALDSFIQDRVTFIKMDIEGAELDALKGAEQIILRDKPKLAICIYHKAEDIWEIPYYIKTLVPEYKLYIRHYSNNDAETVLYAIYE